MTLAGLSIRRPVATTMVMISIMFIGLMAMFTMKSELLPNMDIPVVTVTTTWNGAVVCSGIPCMPCWNGTNFVICALRTC